MKKYLALILVVLLMTLNAWGEITLTIDDKVITEGSVIITTGSESPSPPPPPPPVGPLGNKTNPVKLNQSSQKTPVPGWTWKKDGDGYYQMRSGQTVWFVVNPVELGIQGFMIKIAGYNDLMPRYYKDQLNKITNTFIGETQIRGPSSVFDQTLPTNNNLNYYFSASIAGPQIRIWVEKR